MSSASNVVLQIQGLTKLYRKVVGVKDLHLAVRQGEIFGFLGPNGSGKTTTIRLLTGFLHPTSGSATILGMDVWRDSHRLKREMGFLPDVPSMYENLRGNELLDLLGRLQRKEPLLRDKLCDELGLSTQDLARPVREFSRGMKQKLALVQALQHDPAFIVLDEPTEGLDPLVQQSLFHILQELQRRGHTIFMSSHVLPEVERLCQRVGIIRRGVLVAVEDVEELRHRSIRYMEVEMKADGAVISPSLPGVVSVEQRGRRFRIGVKGNGVPLLRELDRLGMEELVYEQARLEDIFLSYYRE
ncbi:MAG: ABC transporter ATP-binding protein [Chloroflexi bacterium]|nr:ABC transporter ATP-binding protein [Chloroflexota bacterium]